MLSLKTERCDFRTIPHTSDCVREMMPSGDRPNWPKLYKYITGIVQHLWMNNRAPAILFCFKKRDFEWYASQVLIYSESLRPRRPFIGQFKQRQLKEMIEKKLEDAKIARNDEQMSYVRNPLNMLEHGIGIHHAGLLPVVRRLFLCVFRVKLTLMLAYFIQISNHSARVHQNVKYFFKIEAVRIGHALRQFQKFPRKLRCKSICTLQIYPHRTGVGC